MICAPCASPGRLCNPANKTAPRVRDAQPNGFTGLARGNVSVVTSGFDGRGRAQPASVLRTEGAGDWVFLEELVSELAPALSLHRDQIRQRLRARTITLAPGWFDMRALVPEPHGWVGLLVLEGLIQGQLDAGKARVGWLLGEDDLLRPWELDDYALTRQTSWQALTQTMIALLDADFERRVAVLPGVMRALLTRAQRTSHWLIAKSLIISSPVIEERVLLLFALLGERWGKVSTTGVRLELPLTHSSIARLVGARRPTITMTLKSLHERGACTRDERGCWLLTSGLGSVESRSWQLYREALGYRPPAPDSP